MILADTSVWVDHLRRPDPQMMKLLSAGRIAIHPYVIAEVALGSLYNRRRKLAALEDLFVVNVADTPEVRHLIESHSLHSKGLGLIDVHLIASCLMTLGVQLWTRDGALRDIATSLGVHADLT